MKRRRFLGYCAAAGLSSALCGRSIGSEPGDAPANPENATAGLLIADPHAHPSPINATRSYDPSKPNFEIMAQLNMALSAFAAVGDLAYHSRRFGTPFMDTQDQLLPVKRLEEKGQIRLALKAADLPAMAAAGQPLVGLMAIEGGDALEGRLENLDAFHAYGVRMLTLVHDRDNELGYNQRSGNDGPLSRFGVEVVERMNRMGMLIDVAHAKSRTLQSIAEVSAMPLVDSHTSAFIEGEEGSGPRRLRSWRDMEIVAKSGGVVCTWPFGYGGKTGQRDSLKDWAEEIVRMKARLGIAHCGLGTDGGGGLPRFVKGWESIASLPKLIGEMRIAGLTQADIAAFVGGNVLRLLGKTLA